jgi:hypothetical protein
MERVMRKVLTTLILVSALPLAAQAAGSPKIQCWTDDKGVRSCGDHVPPQYAKQEREIYNSEGVVVDKKDRQKTPEEIAEDDRKAAAAAEADRVAQTQKAYDKFLTDTYSSSKELEAARTLREQTMDGRMSLLQKSIADNKKALADLHGRVDALNKAGKKPDQHLLDQIKKFEASLADSEKSTTQLTDEKARMVAKFNQDIERYKQLRPGS